MFRHAFLLALFFIPASLAAQEDDEDSPFQPGLVATYSQRDAQVAMRIEPSPALLAKVLPADPRFARGGVEVQWQGRLLTQGADNYRLHVYGVGKFSLDLGGKEVLRGESDRPQWFSSEVLKFEHDYHPLVVRFSGSTDEGQLRLFWSSDSIVLEPIAAKQLWHEAKTGRPTGDFERGRELARAGRCAACHVVPGETEPLPAPALDKLAGHIQRDWLIWWLDESEKPDLSRRHYHGPAFRLGATEAAQLATLLVGDKIADPVKVGDPQKGKRLFETVGCLACHRVGEQGSHDRLGGGDLTTIADKRPQTFFAEWLASPAALNRDHRMPTYELSKDERDDLAGYLASLRSPKSPTPRAFDEKALSRQRGVELANYYGCANCHRMPGGVERRDRIAWKGGSARPWQCEQRMAVFGESRRAHYYDWTDAEKSDLAEYVSTVAKLKPAKDEPPLDGLRLLAEKQCLSCHAREGSSGLAPKLLSLAKSNADLAPLVPALTPPSLAAVGDKLNDPVLLAMMKRMEQPHRDYLQVRMPRFNLSQDELEAMLAYFVNYDRIPPQPPDPRARPPQNLPKESELEKAGEKLVVAGAGLSCTSCHAIGKFQPTKAPINARGPNIGNAGFRIREPFFYRWCKNPARIIPGQEMPSVSVPVKGVLKENIDHQLAAVWTILNKPGFAPKDAGPLRIVRRSGDPKLKERAIVGTDIFKADGKTYIAPLVIGLPNRHNLLFDLETGRLARWWLGDMMEQRTEGKSWYWMTESPNLLPPGGSEPELVLEMDGTKLTTEKTGQWSSPLQRLKFGESLDARAVGSLIVNRRMAFKLSPRGVTEFELTDMILPTPDGFMRMFSIQKVGAPLTESTKWDERLHLRLRFANEASLKEAKVSQDKRVLSFGDNITIALEKDSLGRFAEDGTLLMDEFPKSGVRWNVGPSMRYRFKGTSDLLSAPLPAEPSLPATTPAKLDMIPGLSVLRLGMSAQVMPTGFTWSEDDLFACSLNGQIWRVREKEGALVDAQVIADGLAAPYGIQFVPEENAIDYITKDALWRMYRGRTGLWDEMQVLASGWGYTDDYHDWAVGMAADELGYSIALPCQQDKRSEAATKFRGQVLKVQTSYYDDEERKQTKSDIELTPLSTGHRFPMGLAKNRAGDLFVTDNQGNYNPFNELNHVQKGKDFGFVNANDKGKPKPPLTPPAINIPHPWTRSVNGICFLDTPEKIGKKLWGPFEGHLIGCEYDTRRLIRMSLQKVGDTYQGACYPFSLEKPQGENFLGPISCAISPRGELYIGSIRDSGWGGGANVGEIVRIEPPKEEKSLPPGIAEVTASKEGFTIAFTQSVDAKLAADVASYSLESYTRESTPAYGGEDLHRRVEKIAGVSVAEDRRNVKLKLDELRPGGYVYEFHLKNLAGPKAVFFPAEAYYTLNVIP
jgi:mono/diheme cytochrome c family protein